MAVITAGVAGSQNRVAFLDAIAGSEIGAALLAATDNGYNVLVGSTLENPLTFPSYADHPNILNKEFDSTAAGRYQLLHLFWADRTVDGELVQGYKNSLDLTDFSPLAQDKVALQQIRECHALPDIDAGNFTQAVALVAHLWASFPAAGYGQHQNTLESLLESYVAAGGTVAA